MRSFSIAICLFPSTSAWEVAVLDHKILANSFEQRMKLESQERYGHDCQDRLHLPGDQVKHQQFQDCTKAERQSTEEAQHHVPKIGLLPHGCLVQVHFEQCQLNLHERHTAVVALHLLWELVAVSPCCSSESGELPWVQGHYSFEVSLEVLSDQAMEMIILQALAVKDCLDWKAR